MNTVKCAICSQEVSKRQTLAIGDGKRACRSHETTVTESTKIQSEAKEQRQKQLDKLSKPFAYAKHVPPILTPTCSICRCPGLRQDEWFARLMIEWAKYEIVHGKSHNIFDATEARKAAGGLAGTPCLWWVKWEGNNKKVKIPFETFHFAEMFGLLLACGDCCKSRGLKTASDEQSEKMSLEQMSLFGLAAELAKPAIKEIAAKEMARSN